MPLPDQLNEQLYQLLSTVPRHALTTASEQLTHRYRSSTRDQDGLFMTDRAHRLAYLAVRFPATYAVVESVLEELKLRVPMFSPSSIVDYGCGPGTATWAATQSFPSIISATLHERDSALLEIGKELMCRSLNPTLASSSWNVSDLIKLQNFTINDLSILSYVVGELPIDLLPSLISKIWSCTSQVIVVIEPGTPHGFERIRVIRNHLIANDAYLVAPCPHQNQCPMRETDWCHFPQRLDRSEIHRAVKEVNIGYEDEKYSYIIASKVQVKLPDARIIRHPKTHSGHVELSLCAQSGLEQKTISRRHGALYKQIRKCHWGDGINLNSGV